MSETAPMLTYWMGKNMDEMTREEAIAALKVCSRMWERLWKERLARLADLSAP